MNIIAWILLVIVALNVIAFGIMWIVFIREERRRAREKRERSRQSDPRLEGSRK